MISQSHLLQLCLCLTNIIQAAPVVNGGRGLAVPMLQGVAAPAPAPPVSCTL
jgi:hypothetical protein